MARTSGGAPLSIKVFGERHTGTNLLEKLISRNSQSVILPGTTGQHRPLQWVISETLGAWPEARELFVDLTSIGIDPRYSWKHAATRFRDSRPFETSGIVFLVKHPLSWLVSMSRKPHQFPRWVPREPNALATTRVATLTRERLGRARLLPLEIWCEKVRSYLHWSSELSRHGIPHMFLRFEDLVMSQGDSFDQLRPLLVRPITSPAIIESSTKDQKREHSYYEDYYGRELWREHFSTNQAARLLEGIDPELLLRFRYS